MSNLSDSTAASPRERLSQAICSLWWIPLVRGIALLIVGVYALFDPGMTATALTQVIGILLLVEGVLAIAAGVLGQTPSRMWTFARAALVIVIGIFVLGYPALIAGATATIVLYVIAFTLIVSGVLEIMTAIRDRKELEGEGWLMLVGALAVLFGVLMLAAPIAFGLFIVRLLGAYAILYGISLIAFAFRLRKFGKALKR